LIITADTPKWYDYLIMKRPVINQFKKGTLEFCGINPVKVTYISPIKSSSEDNKNKWLNKISFLGENLK
jgi:NAD(P)H dehydrogenase (quinone)